MLFRSLGNRAQPLLICGVDPSIAVRVGSWGNRQARLRRKLGTGIDDRDTPGTAQAFLRPCRLSVVGEMIEPGQRSEEHTSELQSLMRISYAVFCLKKKKTQTTNIKITH